MACLVPGLAILPGLWPAQFRSGLLPKSPRYAAGSLTPSLVKKSPVTVSATSIEVLAHGVTLRLASGALRTLGRRGRQGLGGLVLAGGFSLCGAGCDDIKGRCELCWD